MAKRNLKPWTPGASYRTADALSEAWFAAMVDSLVAEGNPRADAEAMARRASEAMDVIVQNPDGTFRFYEPKAGDIMVPSKEALARAKAAQEAGESVIGTTNAGTFGAAFERLARPVRADLTTTPAGVVVDWPRLVEAVDKSGDLHKRFPREYASWRHAKARVSNRDDDKWKSHGGRGIGMCLAWRNSFARFLKDMGRRPAGTTLERKDNNLGYNPGNCVWATTSKQNAN